MWELIARLDAADRKLLVQVIVLGDDFAEIAAASAEPAEAVRRRYRSLVGRLRSKAGGVSSSCRSMPVNSHSSSSESSRSDHDITPNSSASSSARKSRR